MKVTQADSPYFKIISPNNVGHKVGPGLPTTFHIQFMPDEKKVIMLCLFREKSNNNITPVGVKNAVFKTIIETFVI